MRVKAVSNKVMLAVPGGLAGQLFAIAYAAWIRSRLGLGVHIQFHDVGTSISELSVEVLLQTPKAESLEITYSGISGEWPPRGTNPADQRPLPRLTYKLRRTKLYRTVRNTSLSVHLVHGLRLESLRHKVVGTGTWILRKEDLLSSHENSILVGYPVDYQIVEEAWPLVSQMIRESPRKAIVNGVGQRKSIAVHWRLGDYLGNQTHGTVSWSGIWTTIQANYPDDLPVHVMTDSPELARRLISGSLGNRPIVVHSTDIWTDLREMTASQVFIGTNSGISIAAALTLSQINHQTDVWLPDRWFINETLESAYSIPEELYNRARLYPAKLVTNHLPA